MSRAKVMDLSRARYGAELSAERLSLERTGAQLAFCAAALVATERLEARDESARAALAAVEACHAREHERVLLSARHKLAERVASTKRLEALCSDLEGRNLAAQKGRKLAEAQLKSHANRDAKSLNAALAVFTASLL